MSLSALISRQPSTAARYAPASRHWCARLAAIIAEDLDCRLVVQLQHFAERETDGVIAQIRGHIADAQTPSVPVFARAGLRGNAVRKVRATDEGLVVAIGPVSW